MDKYLRLKDAFALIKEEHPEATMPNVRRMILEGVIPSRRTSGGSRAWIFVRPCDIVSYYESLNSSNKKK